MADDENNTPPKDATPDGLGEAGKQAIDRMKAERNEAERIRKVAEKRAADAESQLEQIKSANQSEQDKAIEAARKEGYTAGRSEATKEVGGLLVDAEFRAATTGRLTDEARDAYLENVDRAKFLGTDGSVDRAALIGWVDKIAPAPAPAENTNTNTHQHRPVETLRPGAAPAAVVPVAATPQQRIASGLAEYMNP